MRRPLPFAAMMRAGVAAGRRERAVMIHLCLGICLMGVLLVFAVSGATQARFRITYNVQSRDTKAILLGGRVFNDTGRDALDVWVTAEALSASGKVLARGIAFVSSAILRGDSASFEAKLPSVEGVETFRIAVTSYRAGSEVQSP
jgi:hypothetical protein